MKPGTRVTYTGKNGPVAGGSVGTVSIVSIAVPGQTNRFGRQKYIGTVHPDAEKRTTFVCWDCKLSIAVPSELLRPLPDTAEFTVEGRIYAREQALKLIYRHAHPDFKGIRAADGKRTMLVNRGSEGTCLVELDALTNADILDKLPYAVSCEAKQQGQPELPPDAGHLHEILDHAKRHGDVTSNGVAFSWWLANADGAGFELLREPNHTDEDIEAAKRHLRNERDVVSLRVVRVPPLQWNQE